jgi:hypothetical protein
MKTTTITYYEIQLADGYMFHGKTFDTMQEAIDMINSEEYRMRNKKDGYDGYWRRIKTEVVKVTKTATVVCSESFEVDKPVEIK